MVSHKRIEANASVQNFINNFKNIFFDHYEKIDSYKKRVDEVCGIKRKHLWFVAEIISPMQCVAQTENGVELIHPLMFEDFYMSIKGFDKIEGLVFVNDGSFLILPRRDYKKANRNYNADSVNLELTNPMSNRSIHFINLSNK